MSDKNDAEAKIAKMKTCVHDARALMNFTLNEMPRDASLNSREDQAAIVFAGNLATQGFQNCMARKPAPQKSR